MSFDFNFISTETFENYELQMKIEEQTIITRVISWEFITIAAHFVVPSFGLQILYLTIHGIPACTRYQLSNCFSCIQKFVISFSWSCKCTYYVKIRLHFAKFAEKGGLFACL